jgi:hypothetical protein
VTCRGAEAAQSTNSPEAENEMQNEQAENEDDSNEKMRNSKNR